MNKPKLSIIIPAYNEEKYIEKTLLSIKNQNFDDYEVIVVCNGCTDNTAQIAENYATVISAEDRSCPGARNIGARNAKGDKLVFLDADTRLEDRNTLSKIYQSNAVIGTCFGKPNKDIMLYRSYFLFKNFASLFGMVNNITFCNRETFHKVGGYNEKLYPTENRDIIQKMRKYGKFRVIPKFVRTSMRRYERFGILGQSLFWIKKFFGIKEKYEDIR